MAVGDHVDAVKVTLPVKVSPLLAAPLKRIDGRTPLVQLDLAAMLGKASERGS